MEWPPDSASNEDAANSNPWLPAASSSSSSNDATVEAWGQTTNGDQDLTPTLPANPLYQASPELGAFPEASTSRSKPSIGHVNPEATRPTLYRLTSTGFNGLLNGFDSLSFPNASQESLSTEATGPNDTRRSLDELRRLSIKGKGREIGDDVFSNDALGRESLQKSRPRGREALLHPVEEGDTLQRLALLYGCTVPAIRSANKIWAKDPIYPRKTLYIPLDACKQPPSKDVEFVQRSGEDEVQLYMRQSKAPEAPSFSAMVGKNSIQSTSRRSRSDSLRLEALAEMPRPLTPYRDSEPNSNADSPISSQRSSFDTTRQASASSHFNYLSSTTSEYGGSDDGLGRQPDFPDVNSSGTFSASPQRTNGSPFRHSMIDLPKEPPQSTSTLQKTLQIVQIPGPNIKKSLSSATSSSRLQGRSPLISVDNLEDTTDVPPSHGSVVSNSSTSLDASVPSSDRLGAPSSEPTNLRLRPRSPFDPGSSSTDLPPTNDTGTSSLSVNSQRRTRKNSKGSVPVSASSNKKSPQRLTGSLSKYISSAGAGLVSSLMGDKNASNSGWLATSELETEMQMAKEYQSRHQSRTSISSERALHSRSRSSASLRSQMQANGSAGRRAPSLSAARQSNNNDLLGDS